VTLFRQNVTLFRSDVTVFALHVTLPVTPAVDNRPISSMRFDNSNQVLV
jgi:hypothetical protein